MLDLKFAELHTPAFVAGTNLGLKLQTKNRAGLKLEFDEARQLLLVHYKEETGIIPLTNVACMIETSAEVIQLKEEVKVGGKIKSQVSTPQDHVFAGPGAGKTNNK